MRSIGRSLRPPAAIAVLVIVLAPLAGVHASSATRAPEHVITSGSGLAAAAVAVANVDPDFDIWPLYSESSYDNGSSHGLSGAIWPGFLLDAFAWLYGLQPQERGGFGISESQWPNPPHFSKGSSSDFMIRNFAEGCAQFFPPEDCAQAFQAFGDPPGALGVSESRSEQLSSKSQARGARFDFPGVVEATEAWSRTDSHFSDGRTVVESVFTARDVNIGTDLHIDMIEARSVANAGGDRAHSDGESSLKIVGATFGETPVVIDDQGMHSAGDSGLDDLNAALAEEGLEVRASQGREREDEDGEFVDAATGGLLVKVLRERVEESFPEPLVEGKNAACESAESSDLNQEITRVRFDQPNPLYGQVPVPGMPERAQVEQSVPPPAGCPFFNRNFEVTIALGLTDASARLSPLPRLEDLGTGTAAPAGAISPGGFITRTYTIPGETTDIGVPSLQGSAAGLVSTQRPGEDLARKVKILYGVFGLLLVLGLAGRFALRAVSAP
jgi:hypothetical protein